MVKPAAGYRPLAYSAPEAVQTTGTVALRELDERRASILDSISQQGKLDAALKQAIEAADSKARLEDLYLPYRPKRRTKAQIAREAGLERRESSALHWVDPRAPVPVPNKA